MVSTLLILNDFSLLHFKGLVGRRAYQTLKIHSNVQIP